MNINIESKVQYENSRGFANAIVTPTKGEIKVVIMSNPWTWGNKYLYFYKVSRNENFTTVNMLYSLATDK